MNNCTVGFVCFGEVNTPIQRLQMKHDEALAALQAQVSGVVDGGLVIDDPAYETADAAYEKLAGDLLYGRRAVCRRFFPKDQVKAAKHR